MYKPGAVVHIAYTVDGEASISMICSSVAVIGSRGDARGFGRSGVGPMQNRRKRQGLVEERWPRKAIGVRLREYELDTGYEGFNGSAVGL